MPAINRSFLVDVSLEEVEAETIVIGDITASRILSGKTMTPIGHKKPAEHVMHDDCRSRTNGGARAN